MLAGLCSRFIQCTPSTQVSPPTWDPTTPVPERSTSTSLGPLKVPISSSSSFVFNSSGAWSHGTLLLEARESVHPPSYDLAVSVPPAEEEKRLCGEQLGDGQAFLEVLVEARWNDQDLYSEAKVELRRVEQHDLELRIVTPDMSPYRLTSQLSFHVTVIFPPSVPTLPLLRTSGSHWRTLGRSSLASIHFAVMSLKTSNATISLDHARAGSVELLTSNAEIGRRYDVNRGLYIRTTNAGISGTYTVQDDADISTVNSPIDCTVSARRINVSTCHDRITGSYVARESLKVETANGPILGEFVAPGGAHLSTANAMIRGSFRVGKELGLRTANSEIEAKIVLLGDGEDVEAGNAGDDDDPETPPLFSAEDKRRLGSESEQVQEGHVNIEARTCNDAVVVEIGAHARGVTFDLVGRTCNGKIAYRHIGPYDGAFDMSTANPSATLDIPSDHVATYTTREKKILTGKIESGHGGTSSGRTCSMTAWSSNRALSVWVVG